MTRFAVAVVLALLIAGSAARSGSAAGNLPAWAYPTGRTPTGRGCGSCHLSTGLGRPDTASLAGLPARYIDEQIADYRRGVRRSAGPATGTAVTMVAVAASASDDDLRMASEYFSSMAYRPWVRVVEAETVPVTAVDDGLWIARPGSGVERLGNRIVEVADGPLTTGERGDAQPQFVAYAPAGSIKRGETLASTGAGGRTVRCGLCHGDDVKGLGPVPGIAGRSPGYLVRQLYDMQQGFRRGLGADLMKATVARLTEADMIAIAAYAASRTP
jgi:cytochrome c553